MWSAGCTFRNVTARQLALIESFLVHAHLMLLRRQTSPSLIQLTGKSESLRCAKSKHQSRTLPAPQCADRSGANAQVPSSPLALLGFIALQCGSKEAWDVKNVVILSH